MLPSLAACLGTNILTSEILGPFVRCSFLCCAQKLIMESEARTSMVSLVVLLDPLTPWTGISDACRSTGIISTGLPGNLMNFVENIQSMYVNRYSFHSPPFWLWNFSQEKRLNVRPLKAAARFVHKSAPLAPLLQVRLRGVGDPILERTEFGSQISPPFFRCWDLSSEASKCLWERRVCAFSSLVTLAEERRKNEVTQIFRWRTLDTNHFSRDFFGRCYWPGAKEASGRDSSALACNSEGASF